MLGAKAAAEYQPELHHFDEARMVRHQLLKYNEKTVSNATTPLSSVRTLVSDANTPFATPGDRLG